MPRECLIVFRISGPKSVSLCSGICGLPGCEGLILGNLRQLGRQAFISVPCDMLHHLKDSILPQNPRNSLPLPEVGL